MFTTIPNVFQETYGWSPQLTGLAYLGREFSPEFRMIERAKLMGKLVGIGTFVSN